MSWQRESLDTWTCDLCGVVVRETRPPPVAVAPGGWVAVTSGEHHCAGCAHTIARDVAATIAATKARLRAQGAGLARATAALDSEEGEA